MTRYWPSKDGVHYVVSTQCQRPSIFPCSRFVINSFHVLSHLMAQACCWSSNHYIHTSDYRKKEEERRVYILPFIEIFPEITQQHFHLGIIEQNFIIGAHGHLVAKKTIFQLSTLSPSECRVMLLRRRGNGY